VIIDALRPRHPCKRLPVIPAKPCPSSRRSLAGHPGEALPVIPAKALPVIPAKALPVIPAKAGI
jgi:hypothetical protein